MSKTRGVWIDGGKIKIASPTITDGAGHSFVDRRGLFVIHAVMLHTGKVLWFCGHVEDGHYALKSYLFDYANPKLELPSHDFPLHNPALARGSAKLHIPTSENPATPGDFHADLFCSHFVHAADGKVLVVGGSDPDYIAPTGNTSHSSRGEPYVYAFDPGSEKWDVVMDGSNIARLSEGRWYPTAVMLGDGRIAVFSGRASYDKLKSGPKNWEDSVVKAVDILTPRKGGHYRVTKLASAPGGSAEQPLPIYPGLHLAPNGRIYYTHTTWGLEFDPPDNTQSIEIAAGATSAKWKDHAGIHPSQPRREEGMSVLLPVLLPPKKEPGQPQLAQESKILLFGGSEAIGEPRPGTRRTRNMSPPLFDHINDPNDPLSSEILTISNASSAKPIWSAGPTLNKGRINGHGVILPDKTVIIFGGHDYYKFTVVRDGHSMESELYNPATNTTAKMAKLNHPRMYHSAAVLLPDGSVLVAGGADPDPDRNNDNTDVREWQIHNKAPDNFKYPANWDGPRVFRTDSNTGQVTFNMCYNRKDYEIYKPTYFFTPGKRPTIGSIKREGAETRWAQYGEKLEIISPQATSITAAALIRPGAATHHTDTEQRYVELEWDRVNTDLTVTMPTNPSLAPPGYYMLWIIAGNKPCAEAVFILLAEI